LYVLIRNCQVKFEQEPNASGQGQLPPIDLDDYCLITGASTKALKSAKSAVIAPLGFRWGFWVFVSGHANLLDFNIFNAMEGYFHIFFSVVFSTCGDLLQI